METAEGNEHNVLSDVLSDEELTQIPEGVSKKLKTFFNERFEEFLTARAVFETGRQSLEQKLEVLQKDHGEQKLDLDECRGRLELADKYTKELENKVDEARSEVFKLQESVKRLEKESGELRRQRDTASDERDTLQLHMERRDAEIDRMRTELSALSTQLQNAVTAKCQALAQSEEFKSLEITLDFKEKRLEQERTLLSQQMASLEEELAKRTGELQAVRTESSSRALLTEARLAERDEELRIANESVAKLREAHTTLQLRCDELAQKLELQRSQELSMHAKYCEEISAQTKLADLYKSMADDANDKAEEYSSGVKELQEMLEQGTEQYGILETKHNELQLQHERDLAEKQEHIDELKIELERANELLKVAKQERLDHAVEQLAPTAAAASRVLKKGLSLTQIYTQLVDVNNELASEKEENERLNAQMEVILRELQDKAPILQREREDYAAAVSNVTTLTNRLDELLAENHRLREATDEASRVANHHGRENQRLKTELADLARQVCFLLKEVQESRGGGPISHNSMSTSMDADDLASSQIISKKLVTFRDIEGLQENNQKLLSIVRTLSARQEEIERATDEINSGEMKEKLDRYVEQLAGMQAAQDRQSKMLEGLLRQRDMYKNMYQQCLHQTASNSNTKQEPGTKDEQETQMQVEETPGEAEKQKKEREELEKKLMEAETKLKELKDDHESYRKEKIAHEKMLVEESERLRKEAETSSARCCRFKSQLDSANERFHLLQANVASYKAQIKTLEEKCTNFNITIGKHEQSIMMLKDETLGAQARLSRAEVQLENLRQERQLLKDSESRLLKEREVLHRERRTQSVLRADVEAIKASLERAQAEGQLRAEQRLDDAIRECAALRRRLQEEQDRFRDLTGTLELKLNAAQQRLTEERAIAERTHAELEEARARQIEDTKRLEELGAKLRQADANSVAKPITGDESLAKRLKELEVQLSSSQAEVRSLVEQLKAARQHGQQYCDIAESAEAQLRELTTEHNNRKKELETSLKEAQAEVTLLTKQVKDLEEELVKLRSGRQETDSELRERLAIAEQKLEELDEAKGELELIRGDLQTASTVAKEAEEKYAREMVLHSADLQVLAKLKEESGMCSEKIATLARERDAAAEALTLEKTAWQEREQRLHDEIHETQKRVADLDAQNALLHDQIQELSDRAAIMQSHQSKLAEQESPNTSLEGMNRSFTGIEEDSKSAEQLFRVMKYLRREKDLAIAKFDVLRAENLRLKSQFEVAEKRLKEAETLLSGEREKSEIDVVTAAKHSELLRKVETLNAITDSNRILREERDNLTVKVNELTLTVTALSEEVVPLREKARDLVVRTEALTQENTGLKGEATRWRQRANTLVERVNKASPEDWRRLQTERENLSKLLTSEREVHTKRMEELNSIKAEKGRLEDQLGHLQQQIQSQSEQIAKVSEESRKLSQELNESVTDSATKSKDIATLRKDITDKEAALTDIKNKEIQIRKIAKKYKTQFEELARSVEEEKAKSEETRSATAAASSEEAAQLTQEREQALREEGRQELRQLNNELASRVEELSRQIAGVQNESETLKREVETLNKASVEKEERAKQVLKGARTKILMLTEAKKTCEKELTEMKAKAETQSGDSDSSEHDARVVALKSQMEGRISRLEHEKAEVHAEKEALAQRVAQLQRQLSVGVGSVSGATTEPPTANIKPMSARAETPLASIRPMSVVVQSRTAAVLPTAATAPVLVAPQAVHTTETSSPTSSHTDYQPASTSSSSSQTAPSNLRQLAVQPQLNESAESTQREDPEGIEIMNVQSQQCQQQQQTVALVSPRVEQQTQMQQAATSDQQQTVASSSTQSVSTSQATTGHKRPRSLDTTASGSGIVEGEGNRQELSPTPKTKRSRQQEVNPTHTASVADVEYQVPTSSQRDQDEEAEDGCVVVVDCDEGEGAGAHQAQEEEEFDNDGYEEMEEEEELPYGVEVEVEGDNNEVEIIMEEDSTGAEVPRQAQPTTATNQQQSEAISSAGPTGEPPSSFAPRSSRGIAPMPRQQQQQHLLLPQQGYEDGGDDCIVPSTPTLFVPRRGDGFGEAVSSPQVPQGRFTFGDPAPTATVTVTAPLPTPTGGPTRAMFGSSGSGVAQVAQEGMDDTRMDLTQLEDAGTGRSVPTTPLQVSPAADLPASLRSGQSEEQEAPVSANVAGTAAVDAGDEAGIPSIRVINVDDQELVQPEATTGSDDLTPPDGVSSEGEKRGEDGGASGSGAGDEDAADGDGDEEAAGGVQEEQEEEGREAEASPSCNTRQRRAMAAAGVANGSRTATARRSARLPFRASRGPPRQPIIWGENQPGRGHNAPRGPPRGAGGEGRVRGARGRRMNKPFYRY